MKLYTYLDATWLNVAMQRNLQNSDAFNMAMLENMQKLTLQQQPTATVDICHLVNYWAYALRAPENVKLAKEMLAKLFLWYPVIVEDTLVAFCFKELSRTRLLRMWSFMSSYIPNAKWVTIFEAVFALPVGPKKGKKGTIMVEAFPQWLDTLAFLPKAIFETGLDLYMSAALRQRPSEALRYAASRAWQYLCVYEQYYQSGNSFKFLCDHCSPEIFSELPWLEIFSTYPHWRKPCLDFVQTNVKAYAILMLRLAPLLNEDERRKCITALVNGHVKVGYNQTIFGYFFDAVTVSRDWLVVQQSFDLNLTTNSYTVIFSFIKDSESFQTFHPGVQTWLSSFSNNEWADIVKLSMPDMHANYISVHESFCQSHWELLRIYDVPLLKNNGTFQQRTLSYLDIMVQQKLELAPWKPWLGLPGLYVALLQAYTNGEVQDQYCHQWLTSFHPYQMMIDAHTWITGIKSSLSAPLLEQACIQLDTKSVLMFLSKPGDTFIASNSLFSDGNNV